MNSLKTMFSEAVGRRLFVLAILAVMGTAIGFGQPAAPTQLYATVLNDTSIQLNWRDNSSDEANFFIDARTSPLGIWAQAGSALQNVTTATINGRAPNGQYAYRVYARNFETGFSDYSNTVTAKQTNGTFTVPTASPRPTQTRGVIVGDLRDNGVQRIVATAFNSDSLYVFNRSGSTFVTEVGIKVGTSNDLAAVAVGDVDNDGQTEFVVSSVAASMMYVYGWNGSTYIQERSQSIAAGYGVAIVDIDGDGANELVIANNGVQVFRYRSSSGLFQSVYQSPSFNSFYLQVAVGDPDGDGKPEVCVMGSGGAQIVGHNGTSFVVEATIADFPAMVAGGAFLDFNGDGKDELVTAVFNVGATIFPIFRVRNTIGSTYVIDTIGYHAQPFYQISSGDIDGDGIPEAVLSTNGLVIMKYASGIFTKIHRAEISTGSGHAVMVKDVDADGAAEMISSASPGVAVANYNPTGGIPSDAAPATPTGFVADAATNRITLTWNANGELDFEKYRIYYGSNPNPTALLRDIRGRLNTSYVATGLTPGVGYYFRILAYDVNNNISGSMQVYASLARSAIAEVEPNNDTTNAQVVFLGDTVKAAIAGPSDADYYRLDVPLGDSVVVRLFAGAGTNLLAPMSLYASNGGWYADAWGFPSYDREVMAAYLPAGRYYIRIASTSNSGSFPNSSRRDPPVDVEMVDGPTLSVMASDSGTYELRIQRFTATKPEIGNPYVSSVFSDGAGLSVPVHNMGNPTSLTIEYGKTTALGQSNTVTPADIPELGTVFYTYYHDVAIPNLQPSSLYYYRVTATNAFGQSQTVLSSFATPAASQVFTRRPAHPLRDYVRTVQIIDRDRAYSGSDNATMGRTSDGGTTWRVDPIPFGTLSMRFLDANVGVATTYGGIYRTTNGGTSWSSVASGSYGWLYRIRFVDNSNGLAAGSGGAILRSTSGGSSWGQVTSGTTASFMDVGYASSTVAIAVGYLSGGVAIRSTDGGQTWSAPLALPTTSNLYSVGFVNSTTGFIGGASGVLFKTTDGGQTWSNITSSLPPGSNGTIWTIRFEGQHGFMVGNGGRVWESRDGGSSWQLIPSGTTNTLIDVQSLGSLTYAVGAGGAILRGYFPSPEIEPNGDTTTAKSLVYGDMVDGAIGSASDIDYYSFSAAAGDTIDVSFKVDSLSGLAANVTLRNSAGTSLADSRDFPSWNDQRIIYRINSAGKYFLRVQYRYNSSATFPQSVLPGPDGQVAVPEISTSVAAQDSGLYRLHLRRLEPTAPVIAVSGLIGAFSDEAQVQMSINPAGGILSDLRVEYGETPTLGSIVLAGPDLIASLNGSIQRSYPAIVISGLQAKTTYYYRFSATSSGGTSVSDLSQFNTPAPSPLFRRALQTSLEFRGIVIPKMFHAVAGGAIGVVARTSDNGTSWRQDTIPSTSFWDMAFSTLTNGVGISISAQIRRTTDGGATWSTVSAPASGRTDGIAFGDASTGLIVGSNGMIFRTTNGGANWVQVVSGTTSHLWKPAFATPTVAYVVGDGGLILKSTDAGATWSGPISSGVTATLYAIEFASSSVGYATGGGRTLIKTTDGGTTWENHTAKITQGSTYYGLDFAGTNLGYVAGEGGYIARTTDGGTTWNNIPSGTTNFFWRIATDGRTTYAVGGGGALLSASEPLMEFEPNNDTTNAMVVSFGDSLSGAITGPTDVDYYKFTVASQDTFEFVAESPAGTNLYMRMAVISQWGGYYADNYGFPSYDRRRMVAVLSPGTYYLRLTYGSNYSTNFPQSIRDKERELAHPSLSIQNQTAAFDSGTYALKLYRYRPAKPDIGYSYAISTFPRAAGISVDLLSPGYPTTMRVEYGPTPSYGSFALSSSQAAPSTYAQSVFTNLDGLAPGQTYYYRLIATNAFGSDTLKDRSFSTPQESEVWTPSLTGSYSNTIQSLWMVNELTAYAASPYPVPLFYRTSDGGVTWRYDTLTFPLYGLTFLNAFTGFGASNSGQIYKTTDAGATWALQTNSDSRYIMRLRFQPGNSQIGVGVGYSGAIIRTTNGGANWSAVTNNGGATSDINDVVMLSGGVCYAAGYNEVLKSTDAGANWTRLPATFTNSPYLQGLFFLNATTGYVVGTYGNAHKTTDGGATWTAMELPFAPYWLSKVIFVDSQRGFIVGGGVAYYTSDGGTTWTRQVPATNNYLYDLASVNRTVIATGEGSALLRAVLPLAETEPNNTPAQANTAAVGEIMEARIFPTGDIDFFQFTAAAGDTIEIFGTSDISANLKGELSLFDAAQARKILTSSYLPNSTSQHLIVPIQNAGTYLLRYAHSGSDTATGGYRLRLRKFLPGKAEVQFAAKPVSLFHDMAVLSAQVYPNGSPTSVTFQYGAPSFDNTVTIPDPLTGIQPVLAAMPTDTARRLAPNTVYNYRAVTQNAFGQTFGSTNSFRTPAFPDGWAHVDQRQYVAAFMSTYSANSQQGVVVGGQGTILTTTNGGTTWIARNSGTTDMLRSIWFADATTAFAVGENNTIAKSTNGGITWSTTGGTELVRLNRVRMLDANFGYIVGDNATILRTTNGGGVWQKASSLPIPSDYGMNGLAILPDSSGIAVGTAGMILRTNKVQPNWTIVKQIAELQAGDALTDISVLSNSTWVVTSAFGKIFRTVDAGSNWTEVSAPAVATFISMRFFDGLNGIIVGTEGTILRTNDGGISWTKEESGTANALFDAWFATADTVVATGFYGTFLRYERPATPPVTPTLASPNDGATDVPTTAVIQWQKTQRTTSYHLQVSTDAGFIAGSFVVNDSTLTDTSYAASLQYSTLYHWRVRSRNVVGASDFSASRSFTTGALPPPGVVSLFKPTNGSSNQVVNPRFEWYPVPTALAYRIDVATDSLFADIVLSDAAVTDTAKQFPTPLTGGTEYFWRVRGSNTSGTGGFSVTYRFTTSASAAIVQTLPATQVTSISAILNGTINPNNTTQTVYFEWGELGQFDQVMPSHIVSGSTTLQIADTIKTGLQAGKVYNFRIVASAVGITVRADSVVFAPGLVPPETPVNFRAQLQSLSSVRLTWASNSTNETGFALYRRVSTSATYDSLGRVSAGTYLFDDNTVIANEQYYYRIRAYNLAGFSGYTDSASILVKVAPLAALNFSNFDYGNVETRIGTKDTVIRVYNNGAAELTVGSMTLGGTSAGEFVITTSPIIASIAPQGSKDYTVRFRPMTPGTKVAAVFIGTNDLSQGSPAGTLVVNLTGQSSDTQAPGVPFFPAVSPSVWSNAAQFTVTWSDPGNDASGIRGILYQYDAAPTPATPGTFAAARTSAGGLAADVPAPAMPGIHTLYFYQQDSSLNSNTASAAQVIVQSDRTLPTISHSNAGLTTMRIEGGAVTPSGGASILASATEGVNESGMLTMTLEYRRVGDASVTTTAFSAPFTSQTATIPAGLFIQNGVAMGVEYRIVALDIAQNSATTPWYGVPTENAANVTVQQPGEAPAANAFGADQRAQAYRIVSFPYDLSDKRPSAHLPAALGDHVSNGVNYHFWRFERFVNQTAQPYETFKDQQALTPGAGFFLIALESGKRIKVNNTTSQVVQVQNLTNTGIALTSGWNLLGDPLPVNMNIADFTFVGGTVQDRGYYSGSGPVSGWVKTGTDVEVLKPWEGIAIRVSAAGTLRYRVAPGGAGVQASVAAVPVHATVPMNETTPNWYVPVDAVRLDNGRTSLGGGFGMAQEAKEGYDFYDSFQPPFIADGNVSLAFENVEGGMMQDVRPLADGGIWEMRLMTGDEGKKVKLTFGDVGVIRDATQEVFLIDLDQKLAYDLKRTSKVEVNSGTGLRQFRVVVGSKSYVSANNAGVDLYPKTMVLSANYPNPFNPETVIRYTVPDLADRSHVTLTVFNLLGQAVAQLVEAEQQTGYYEVTFNARTLGSGVYFYRIEVQSGERVFTDVKKMVLLK